MMSLPHLLSISIGFGKRKININLPWQLSACQAVIQCICRMEASVMLANFFHPPAFPILSFDFGWELLFFLVVGYSLQFACKKRNIYIYSRPISMPPLFLSLICAFRNSCCCDQRYCLSLIPFSVAYVARALDFTFLLFFFPFFFLRRSPFLCFHFLCVCEFVSPSFL